MLILKVLVFIQVQLVTIVSAPSLRKRARGSKLTKKAILTAVLTCELAQRGGWGVGWIVVTSGYASKAKIVTRLDEMIMEVGDIAATWICTKSFWFLRPMDELLSFRSFTSEPRGPTKVVRISSSHCCEPLSVGKGILTLIFRITI